MSRKDSIQKGLAIFLLMVFAISVMPKSFFHHALTRHHDEPVCKEVDRTSPHIHQPTFHCSFDDLVVSAPYLSFHQVLTVEQPPFFAGYTSRYQFAFHSSSFLHTEGRGPPLM